MMLTAPKQSFLLTTLLAVALLCPSAYPQSDTLDPAAIGPPDVFEEIELSATGVIAYDTLGGEWQYDFNQEKFVARTPGSAGESGAYETGPGEEAAEPVQTRCTEEKIVDNPALKAVFVGNDEYVNGDITAYSRVTIKGWVRGNIQSYKRPVLVTASGQVDGDIRAPEIEVVEGGVVLGRQIITDKPIDPGDVLPGGFTSDGSWVVFAFTIALTLIAFLFASLAPDAVDNMAVCARGFPVRSSLVGLGFLFLAPFIFALVVLTIIGVLVCWLVPVAYLVALAMGMAVLGINHGKELLHRVVGRYPGRILGSIAGVLVFMILWAAVAILLGAGYRNSDMLDALGVVLLVAAIILTAYPLLLGIGVAVLTRFGRRAYVGHLVVRSPEKGPAPAPAPPPMPDVPPPVSRPTTPGSNHIRRPDQS